MPTSTFFRLPEEKRKRLIDACWGEMTRVRFTDVSINRIIAAAHIPRGSFYQYFTDKEDLIRYLLEDMREYFVSLLRNILLEAEGDLFALPLMAYDRFISSQGHTDTMLSLFIKLLTLNKGLDLQSLIGSPQGFIGEQQRFLPDPLWEVVDTACGEATGSTQTRSSIWPARCWPLPLWRRCSAWRGQTKFRTRTGPPRCGR